MSNKDINVKGTLAGCGVTAACLLFLLMETLVALASIEAATNATFAPTAFSYPPHAAEDRPPASTTPACTDLQMLIPLYSYPTWYSPTTYIWDDVAAANSQISITAIINPNNGPGGGPPNSDYQQGLSDLRTAGVTILGYVYTSYGERDINVVKAEVDLYDRYFDIDGIFFDEAASDAEKLDYYEELCDYVESRPNLDKVFLNPGTHIAQEYISSTHACDTANIFQGYSSKWPDYDPDDYVSTYLAERFAMLVHTVPDTDTMRSGIDLAAARNIGYVYLTDDTMPNPWDTLPKFWRAEVDYIASLNVCVTWLPLILCNH